MRRSAPKLAAWLENVPEGMGVFALPAAHRRYLRTTNMLERVHKELKRRTRVATTFPNEPSLLRLASAVLMEISEECGSAVNATDNEGREQRRGWLTALAKTIYRSTVALSFAALTPLLSHRPEDMKYLTEVAAIIQPKFNELPKEAPYYGMIHGDVIRANAQVSDNGSVTILISIYGLGWRAYDVASYLQVAGTDEAKQAFWMRYREIHKITNNELELLPIFEAARHFSLGVPAMNVYH